MAEVDLSKTLPGDLLSPEGKTRWDLTGLSVRPGFIRSIEAGEAGQAGLAVKDGAKSLLYGDDEDGISVKRWLLPDRDAGERLRPGEREYLELQETGRAGSREPDFLRIETEIVGIGWLHLPSGPREAVLQRALILREPAGSRGYSPDLLIHRWIDPRAGVVAEVSGPAAPDGRSRTSLDRAQVVEQVLLGASTLRIHVDEVDDPIYSFVAYGWDRGAGTKVGSLVPGGDPNTMTIGQLAAMDTWDFSGNNSGVERASTTVPVNSSETCNAGRCGYNLTGVELDREDRAFDDPNTLNKINTITQQEQRAGDVTIWLRAGAQHEGFYGGIGTGEARFCYADDGATVHTPVPLWRFPHQDPNTMRWYMQAGDAPWTSAAFNCEQNIFNQVCGAAKPFEPQLLYTKACAGNYGNHAGTQGGSILKAGVVTVPSGHTFNALLARNIADFCIYSASGCASFFKLEESRTTDYLWVVPNLGTVVRLESELHALDANTFTTLAETDIKFGLFPPRSISMTGVTSSTVGLSWDPGLDTHRINGYRVYWDTNSGGGSPYAFNSIANPGQASIVGTTATISGLTSGTTYYFTVTSRSTFTDPSSGIVTTYESLLYPTQVSGDPSFVYPTEVLATTTSSTCIPTQAVQNVTVDYAPGGIRICWDPGTDPCLVGYQVRGALSPQLPGNFSTVADTGLTNCWEGNPAQGFFLVVERGTGGNGP
jgi:hypothetical protein